MTAAAVTGTATVASVVIVIEAAGIVQAGDIPKDTVMVAGIIISFIRHYDRSKMHTHTYYCYHVKR